jgi:hypothetical protein
MNSVLSQILDLFFDLPHFLLLVVLDRVLDWFKSK